MPDLVTGVNLPWLEYGQDFGACAWRPEGGVSSPRGLERMQRALARVAASGARLVRWWLQGDGRSGLREDAAGRVLSLDDRVFPDMDAAMAALRATGLRAVFVLCDFLWFAAPRLVRGVQLGGRRQVLRDPSLREALLHEVYAPIAERYGTEDAIAAWDLCNEPEWATLAVGTLDPRRSLSRREMRGFLAALARVFREGARQPLTVGLASARSLPLVRGLELDFYQVHWYEHVDSFATLARPVARLGLDRPLMLGEFPTLGCSVPPSVILETAAAAGYSSALAWSSCSDDKASSPDACQAALLRWAARAQGDTAGA